MKKSSILGILLLPLLAACPNRQAPKVIYTPEAQAVEDVRRLQAAHVMDIHFPPGSALLESEAKESLVAFVEQVKELGAIDSLRVVAWINFRNGEQKKLADERNAGILAALHENFPELTVNTVRFAERADDLQGEARAAVIAVMKKSEEP
jgi:hypothetical protein